MPIFIQVYLNAGIAYSLNRALDVPHNIACPSALIGASNFFELAVAALLGNLCKSHPAKDQCYDK